MGTLFQLSEDIQDDAMADTHSNTDPQAYDLIGLARQFDQHRQQSQQHSQQQSAIPHQAWAMSEALASHMAVVDAFSSRHLAVAGRYARRGHHAGSLGEPCNPGLAAVHAQRAASQAWIGGMVA